MPQRFQKAVAVCLFVLALLLGVSAPRTTHAEIIGDFAGCAAGVLADVGATLAAGALGFTVPTFNVPEILKEEVKDCAAWVITNAAIEQITGDVVTWANTGFNGNPVYVTNINRTLSRVSDDTFVNFIQSRQVNNFSPSFRNDVAFALIDAYNRQNDFSKRSASTLDEETYDIDAFINGDFSKEGGLGTWYRLTQIPQNNPYGAYYIAQEELGRQTTSNTEETKTQITLGQGFPGIKQCSLYEVCNVYTDPGDFDDKSANTTCFSQVEISKKKFDALAENDPRRRDAKCLENKVITPGSIIHDSVQKTLDINLDRIVSADELNEVIGTLFKGLVTNILTGENGFSGAPAFVAESTDFTNLELANNPVGDGDGDGSGSIFGRGNDIPNPPALVLSEVQWIDQDISSWKKTARLGPVSVSGNTIQLPYDKADEWPTDPTDVNANAWICVYRQSAWYCGTWEWMRPGQTSKFTTNLTSSGAIRGELSDFVAQPGDNYYFLVSTLARAGFSSPTDERSNLVRIVWPERESFTGGGGINQ